MALLAHSVQQTCKDRANPTIDAIGHSTCDKDCVLITLECLNVKASEKGGALVQGSQKSVVAVLEDDRDIRSEVVEALRFDQHSVISAGNVATFEALTAAREVDLYLIDLGLPDANGFDLVRSLRSNTNAGIIIVSGRTSETDKVVGLEIGADDYISKPFSPRELCARVSSVLRRRDASNIEIVPTNNQRIDQSGVLNFFGWTLDTDMHQLNAPDGSMVQLTNAEYQLLVVFLHNRNRALTREALISLVKGHGWAGYDRAMDGLVSRLRRKFAAHGDGKDIIKTIHSVGYLFPKENLPAETKGLE